MKNKKDNQEKTAGDYIELNISDELEDPYQSVEGGNGGKMKTLEESSKDSKNKKFSVNIKKSGQKDFMNNS